MEQSAINKSVRLVDVFFYGLFMDKVLLEEKGCAAINDRLASVDGFSLRIGKRATLIPSANNSVYGIIMSLSHNDIDKLYSEESVSMYRSEAVLVKLSDGTIVPALCFNLPVPPAPGEHNPDYVVKLKKLAGKLKLPDNYIQSIK